ncbi:MAG: beta-lactamase family protein [Bacilli bacterium]|nr:beta-lactamase family protein [Bacilli bacterium]
MNAKLGLDKLIQNFIDDGAFPGANYVLVIKDKTYFGSFGNKALYPEVEKNNIDTLYDMASVSKVVSTTTCILKLMEEGSLRLYSKVSSYLPRFKHDQITVFNLLTHTSGMQEGISNCTTAKSKEEVLDRLYSYDLKYEVGRQIIYSDLNYIMLGEIVETITGKKLNEFAQEILFKPLGMVDTGYKPVDKMRCAPTENRDDATYRGIVRGDVHDETAYACGGVAGHAGVFSTVKDMEHFIRMILNKGTYNGQKILASTTIDRLFIPQVSENHDLVGHYNRRGLGWIVNSQCSSAGDFTSYDDTILHTGFTGTNIWVDRKNQVGFSLLTNRVHPTRKNVKIIDARPKIANYIMAHLDEFE